MYRQLKKTSLKECYIVRYADDFKILCRTRSQANRVFCGVTQFLRERLNLEISQEKSNIVNLKRKKSDFLGFSVKAERKGKTRFGYVAQSYMTEKAIKNASSKIRDCIMKIQKKPCKETVHNFNSTVLGIQNYYCRATQVTKNLSGIDFQIRKVLYNRLKQIRTRATLSDMSPTLKKRFQNYVPKLYRIQHMVFVPIYAQKHVKCINFNQKTCNYTIEGRKIIHENLKINTAILRHVTKNYILKRSIEYNDNRISKFIGQYGRCAVSKVELSYDDWHCHHIIPLKLGGNDHYNNLIILHRDIHKLIHMTDELKIGKVVQNFKLSKEQLNKVNELRTNAHRECISV